jgi:protein TonB
MSKKSKGFQDTVHKPFGVLLASRPPKQAGRTGSSLVALGLHAILGSAVVYATIQAVEEVHEEEVIVELTARTFLPPPPPPPPPPSVEVPDVERPQGFQTFKMPTAIPIEIPPPAASWDIRAKDVTGEGVAGGRDFGRLVNPTDTVAKPDRDTPSFTPHTVRPEISNRSEVQRALVSEYPAMLRDAQIGGTVVVWLFIDTEGRVENSKVQTTSGYPMLDAAALKVANTMRFTPAFNRDQKVPVWVSIPITFTVGGMR